MLARARWSCEGHWSFSYPLQRPEYSIEAEVGSLPRFSNNLYKSADYMPYCFEDENAEELATSFRLDLMHVRLGMSQRTGYRRF